LVSGTGDENMCTVLAKLSMRSGGRRQKRITHYRARDREAWRKRTINAKERRGQTVRWVRKRLEKTLEGKKEDKGQIHYVAPSN